MVNFCVFLCYPLARHEKPLEIFPYGDPLPLPTGKLGKLPPLPPGKSDPFRGGGVMDIFWNHTISYNNSNPDD